MGFVPLVGLYFVCTAAEAFLLQLLGISFIGRYTPEVILGGSLAALIGISIAIRQIRHGVRPDFRVSLAALLILGLAWSFYFRTSWIGGLAGGIGANGLLTLLTWQLFSRLLHLKDRSGITDEVLHFSLCWLVLTALVPAMANTGGDRCRLSSPCSSRPWRRSSCCCFARDVVWGKDRPRGCCFSACSRKNRSEID